MATKGRNGAYQALALAAGRLGVTITQEQLHREYGTARTDPATADLRQIAETAGLKARVASLTWSHLEKLGKAFPVILRMNDDAWYVA
jgi:ATP-binding cassette, subfamily B, bacterial HlyB/CyaB